VETTILTVSIGENSAIAAGLTQNLGLKLGQDWDETLLLV
jgi:hypothetical protein